MAADKTVKPEFTLGIDSFGKSSKEEGVRGLAMRVQNIVLMEKGTDPGIFDMGVGLGMHIFDQLDESLTFSLGDEISRQIRRYLPDVPLSNVRVEKGTSDKSRKSIEIVVELKRPVEGVTELTFDMKQGKDGKLVTDVLV